VIDPEHQYQLTPEQQNRLVEALNHCPTAYQSIVYLAISAANFTKSKELWTIRGIIPYISRSVDQKLRLEPRIRGNLLTNQGIASLRFEVNKLLRDKDDSKADTPRKEKLQSKKPGSTVQILRDAEGEKQKSKSGKATVQKIDCIRDLLALLLCEGEQEAIAPRLSILLEILSDCNHFQQLMIRSQQSDFETKEDLRYRVDAIVELLVMASPSSAEAKRLLLYSAYSQIYTQQQAEEYIILNQQYHANRLQSERDVQCIQELEIKCEELKQKLEITQQQLQQAQTALEIGRKQYDHLEQSSSAELDKQKNSSLHHFQSRIEHELKKLETCLNGSTESLQVNRILALKVVEKIRKIITVTEV
jgi:hypothetical protein